MHNHLSIMDGVSLGSLIAAITGALPTILGILGGILGILWYAAMLYDWVERRRAEQAQVLRSGDKASAELDKAKVKAAELYAAEFECKDEP